MNKLKKVTIIAILFIATSFGVTKILHSNILSMIPECLCFHEEIVQGKMMVPTGYNCYRYDTSCQLIIPVHSAPLFPLQSAPVVPLESAPL
jgi:hypothetical protein